MTFVPGSRMIKKYIYRMIIGFILVPAGPLWLLYTESRAIHHISIVPGKTDDWIYWGARLLGILISWFSLYRIISSIRLVMMKIPLSYQEIQQGIYISSLLLSTFNLLLLSRL